MGKILAICTSPKRGTVKTEVPSAVLTPEWGIVSDAHGGNWHRQVSLLSAEKIEAFRKKIWVDYGAFGENLVIEGFDFRNLPVTSRFAIGDVVLEMTQIGKECHNDCVIKQQTGECIMPREGVFARVLKGGEIHVGDEVTLLPPLEDPPLRAAVITLSDKGSRGEREDKSGPLIVEMLTAAGYVVEETMLLPDEAKALKAQLIRLADGRQVNLILTTGGTGFSPRDITPEATYAVADRSAPGIAEAMRYHSLSITPRGMLSRIVLHRIRQAINEQAQLENYKKLAYADSLTGLFNYTAFKYMKSRWPERTDWTYIVIDVNWLKQTNDQYGHRAGDELLCCAARCIREAFYRAEDCFRIGGDEFAVIAAATDEEAVKAAVETLRRLCAEWDAKEEYPVSIAVGYAMQAGRTMTADELFMEADAAMYQNKAEIKKAVGGISR